MQHFENVAASAHFKLALVYTQDIGGSPGGPLLGLAQVLNR